MHDPAGAPAADLFPEASAPARPPWLVTLADLALLLVGFLMLVQALGRDRTGTAMQAGFGNEAALPVAAAALDGFVPGSAALPRHPGAVIAWAREAVRDPRVTLTLTGEGEDADPVSRSPAILAADRARMLAVALVAAGVPPARLAIATRRGSRRAVTVTLSFSAVKD